MQDEPGGDLVGWQVVGLVLGIVLVIVGLVVVVRAVVDRERHDTADDPEAEEFLAEYFALDEFNDAELRERLEHLRGVPDLR
ncbi:MAG TPA: hypothetical protein VMK16_01375 [Acidimicrobiales bacterium]|nr:hypothetical protein [Acidimicrobiales bacterium]